MAELSAADLTVVIPSRDRSDVVERTLAALAGQTTHGFDIVVVGATTNRWRASFGDVRVVEVEAAGPGAARNAGARSTGRPLLLFLDEGMIPSSGLIAAHLDAHRSSASDDIAVVGRVEPLPGSDVRLSAWCDRCSSRFRPTLPQRDAPAATWGQFYSGNLSLKHGSLTDAGSFDETLLHHEDLDLAYRLQQQGVRVVCEPSAPAQHPHQDDWPALQRRFQDIAVGERLMVAKHDWFEPRVKQLMEESLHPRHAFDAWRRMGDRLSSRLNRMMKQHRDREFYRRLAPEFLRVWNAADDLVELQQYLGTAYDSRLLIGHSKAVDDEAVSAGDERQFYRTSQAYLYDLTMFSMWGTKDPYREEISRHVSAGSRLLDYGCGIGSDGLRFIAKGYRVDFADYDNPSTQYLRWRLQRRGLDANVFDVERDDIPGGYDLAYAFDVIEHVEDPFEFLHRLEKRSAIVAVNLLEAEDDDTHLHHELPIYQLVGHARRHGLLSYRILHGRSHLLLYRSSKAAVTQGKRHASC